jgi:hypothetical protein
MVPHTLAEDVLDVVRQFLERENGENLGFSLMALARGDQAARQSLWWLGLHGCL